jgi:hypothetical protein
MLTSALGAIFATVVVAVAALGIGGWIWTRLPSTFSPFDRLACTGLGGLGMLGTLLFLVGQLSYTRRTIYLALAAAGLLGIGFLLLRRRAVFGLSMHWKRIAALPAIVVGAVLLVTALGGLAEITGDWDNDAPSYHLHGPKVWLREGVVRPVVDDCRTAFPATAEVLYGAEIALGGSRAPGFSALLTLTLLFLIAGSLSVRSGLDARDAWWAVALVAAMPAAYAGSHTCYVDALYASFVLAAARIGFEAQSARDYSIFGLFCGLAMATKYTGLAALPLITLCACLTTARRESGGWKIAARNAGIAIAIASIVAATFYLRNWIVLGCPIYPPPVALLRFFRVKYMSPEAITGMESLIRKQCAGLGSGLGAYLMLPYNLTYHTANFRGAGGFGLAPLAFAPLGLIAARREHFTQALAILTFLLTTFWFVTLQESRYFIAVAAILAIFAVIGWRTACAIGSRISRVLAGAVIACSLAYGVFMIGSSRLAEVHAVLSKAFAEQRRQSQIPALASFEYANRNASVRKLLILDQSIPPYYSDKDYLKPVGQWGELVVPDGGNLEFLLARLHQLNVSHVLDVNSAHFAFKLPENTPGLTLVFERPYERIYRVD